MSEPFFVRSLTRSEQTAICKLRQRPPNLDVYRRAQAVHLSAQGLKAPQIAEIVSRSGQWHRAGSGTGRRLGSVCLSDGREQEMDLSVARAATRGCSTWAAAAGRLIGVLMRVWCVS